MSSLKISHELSKVIDHHQSAGKVLESMQQWRMETFGRHRGVSQISKTRRQSTLAGFSPPF